MVMAVPTIIIAPYSIDPPALFNGLTAEATFLGDPLNLAMGALRAPQRKLDVHLPKH